MFQIELHRLAVQLKRIETFPFWRSRIGGATLRAAAQGCNVETHIAVQDLLQLLRELGAAFDPLILRRISQVDITRGRLVVPGLTSLQEGKDGAARRVAMQWISGCRRSARRRDGRCSGRLSDATNQEKH